MALDLKSLKDQLDFEVKLRHSQSTDGSIAAPQLTGSRTAVNSAEQVARDRKNTSITEADRTQKAGRKYKTRKDSRTGVLALIAGLVILGLAVGGYYVIARRSHPVEATKSMAVLPFKPLSANAVDEHLGLGLADSLITRLSNIKEVIIRPTSSVRKYIGPEQDPIAAGKELQVESVLEGNYQTVGDRIRIAVRLIRVRDGAALWADEFYEKFTDIFAVQDSISTKVGATVASRLSSEQKNLLTKRYTDNTEAYQAYLKGRYYAGQLTKEGFDKGIAEINRAIAIDEKYALAYDALGYYYIAAVEFILPAKIAMPLAREAARKAVQLDDTLAGGHTWLAVVSYWYDWNFDDAEREFRRSIELNPNDARSHVMYGMYLSSCGRHQQAIDESKRAQELDPLSPEVNTFLGQALYFAGRQDEAIDLLRKTIERDPDYWFADVILAQSYEEKKQLDLMLATIQTAMLKENVAPSQLLCLAGHCYALMGRTREALTTIEELKKRSSLGLPDASPYFIAQFYSVLGEREQAFEWLERGYQEREIFMTWLNIDPMLKQLRSDPKFVDLVRRVGLPTITNAN